MINIRSITYFMPENVSREDYKKINEVSMQWLKQEYYVRTQRVCFTPFSHAVKLKEFSDVIELCEKSNVRWFNIPLDPWECEDIDALFKSGQDLLKNNGRSFINILTVKDGKIDEHIIKKSSNFIKNTALLSHNGKDNFRVGLSFNISNYGPFFPFTKSGGKLSFSIALELTQEINMICKNTECRLDELRDTIISTLSPQIERIEEIANGIAKKNGIDFNGFDFSLAPIIDENGSVIPILNFIGVYNFGKCGSMFATSYITNLLKYFAKKYKSVGFSGVMYSLLEDLELCSINNAQGVTLEEFIMLSTMCGCGLDMVPVYGDVSEREIKSMCYDVYAISTRLNKPLGVRLLPIPGCKKNQIMYTNLSDDADFIANTKVVRIDNNLLRKSNDCFQYL